MKNGAGTLVLNPSIGNSFTGITYVNQGNLTLGSVGVAIPGNLVINNGASVTDPNLGQLASTSNVTINGGGLLSMPSSTNTLASITFIDNGGTSTPTVTTGTNFLTLGGGANAISSTNDNLYTTPTISGTALKFSATNAVITVNLGLSTDGLIISAPITSAAGILSITGGGSIVLKGASTFTNGFNLQSGSIIFAIASAGTPPTLTSGPIGKGTLILSGGTSGSTILSDGTLRIIGNAVSVTGGGFTFGGNVAGNGVNLSGIVTLGAGANTINVSAPTVVSTISGQLTGGTNLTKAGPGTLVLSKANNYGGTTTISGGVLKYGASGAITSTSGVQVNAGSVLDLAGFPGNIGSLSGDSTSTGGMVTNSNSSTAVVLTINYDNTNQTFAGIITAVPTANLALTKLGTGNQTLSGASTYTGATLVSGGTLTLANGSTASNPANGQTAAQTATLADTAISVGTAGASLQINTAGAAAATQSTVTVAGTALAGGVLVNTVNIGNTTTATATGGASVTLSAGTSFGFSTSNTSLSTLNIIENAAFTTSGLILSGASGSSSALSFNIGNAGADTIFVTKNATLAAAGGATVTLNPLTGATSIPATAAGLVIPLIESAGGFTGAGTNNFTLITTTLLLGGHSYTLTLAGAQDKTTQTALLVTVAAPTNAYWAGGQDANWNTGISTGVTNWRTDATSNIDTQAVPNSQTNVFFSTTTPTPINLGSNLGVNFSINSLGFLATNTSPTSINGNILTINAATVNGNATGNGINVASGSGSVTVNSAVVLGASQTFTSNSASPLNLNGNITGTANLTTAGSGTINIAGFANAYVGATIVSSGTTIVSGSVSGTTAVSVSSGTSANLSVTGALGSPGTPVSGGVLVGSNGILSGDGTIYGAVDASSSNGIVAPTSGTTNGLSINSTSSPSLKLGASSTLQLNITGAGSASNYSHVTLSNGASLVGGATTLNLLLGVVNANDLFTIIVASGGSVTGGQFAGETVTTTPGIYAFTAGGAQFEVNYGFTGPVTQAGYSQFTFENTSGGHNVAVLALAVPEPNSCGMLIASLGMALGLQRFRRRRSA